MYNTSGQFLGSHVSNIENLFLYTRTYIATSSRGKMIHIANSSYGLVTTNKTGHKLWEKTELQRICGLTTTENDSLIVCNESDGIVTFFMIDREGKTKKELLKQTSESRQPISIVYDATTSKLCVTFCDCDTMEVYNLTTT